MASILLVDDDASFAAALDRLLTRDGHATRVVADTATALAFTRGELAQIDLVLADLQLCQESGLELVRELRRAKPGLPVIVLSAAPDAGSYLDALRLGAYEYLAKPLDFDELRQVVRRALGPLARAG